LTIKKLLDRPTLLLSLASLAVFALFFLFLPSQNIIFSTELQTKTQEIKKLNFTLPPPAPYPMEKPFAPNVPAVSAEGYIVLDVKSDKIILSKNPNEALKTASITKLMTALTAIDIFKPNDVLTAKTEFTDGAIIGIQVGDKFRFSELLKALLIPSANDAAQTIADNSKTDFVKSMNKKAMSLHLNNTFFSNPQGFDDGNNHSTVLDLARIGEYSLLNKTIRGIVRTKTDEIFNLDGTKSYPLTNVNELLFSDPQVQGIKTGYTEEAGECLMSLYEKAGHEVIFVVLKSNDRFGETKQLSDYVFSNFIWDLPQTHMP
jgi:serine-type D-Ala-D-Ala carboxypeptidase (penicillin-binding protein 5/6)